MIPPIFFILFQLAQQAGPSVNLPDSPPDVSIWVTLIMSITSIVIAVLNKRSSNRHGAEIADLKRQLKLVQDQFQEERRTWHNWMRKVLAYLRKLPNGDAIVAGLPPLPDSIKRSHVIRLPRVVGSKKKG